ncbi:DEAD-box ATP-dependent RNA helicase [Williamsoniiplasma luminosum]|uniref:DEAD-box ATP-dependent RNA helicase n=1 Tax=Williamsoniiplasma luminosum TaxID=214888 RepID=A0A2K8NU35_9MOLU|nr:DEAD/DEAH box helicase [Williamsoniiplasma luminosum]ATZ17284.1 DEAD-box ATP-dependent RNA helicase [Williamsoniiplasma luminosum]
MAFKKLELNDSILRSLEKNGFTKPTEIQEKGIPVFLENKNLFGKSSTGTGKTASFALPILHKIDVTDKKVQAVVMAPTRELALQILDQFKKFSSMMANVQIAPLIGGARMGDQIAKLKNCQIVVGTPGRINDHINRKTLRLDNVKIIILDEADEMLKLGFKNDIDAVFNGVENKVQIGLYSATISPKVLAIANKYMGEYEFIEVQNQMDVNNNINNTYVITKGYKKEDVMVKLIEKHNMQRFIIFTNTRANTTKISRVLDQAGIKNEVINGDKKQSQRTRVMRDFKTSRFRALIATDVVARGIHVDGIDYVINFEMPVDDEYFVHRIGRTGRNNETGSTITFINSINAVRHLNHVIKEFNLEIDEELIDDIGLEKSKDMDRPEIHDKYRPRTSYADRRDSGRGNSRGGSRSGSRDGQRSDSRGGSRSGSRDGSRNNSWGDKKPSSRSNSWSDRGASRDGAQSESRTNSRDDSRSNSWGDSKPSSRSNSWGDKKPTSRDGARSDSRSNSWGDKKPSSRDGARSDSRSNSWGDKKPSSRSNSWSDSKPKRSSNRDGFDGGSKPGKNFRNDK